MSHTQKRVELRFNAIGYKFTIPLAFISSATVPNHTIPYVDHLSQIILRCGTYYHMIVM